MQSCSSYLKLMDAELIELCFLTLTHGSWHVSIDLLAGTAFDLDVEEQTNVFGE